MAAPAAKAELERVSGAVGIEGLPAGDGVGEDEGVGSRDGVADGDPADELTAEGEGYEEADDDPGGLAADPQPATIAASAATPMAEPGEAHLRRMRQA